MNTMRIAFRNLNRQKKRSFLLGGAIAFGILIITLVNSFTAGAIVNVKDNVAYLFGGQISIAGSVKETEDGKAVSYLPDGATIKEVLISLGYDYSKLVKRSTLRGELIFNGESITQNVFGVHWDEEVALSQRMELLEGDMKSVMDDPLSIIITETMAEKLGLTLGEQVIIRFSTATGQQNFDELTVRAIAADSGILGSIAAYASIHTINEFLGLDTEAVQMITLPVTPGTNLTLAEMTLRKAITDAGLPLKAKETPETQNMSLTSFTFKERKEDPWSGTRYTVTTIEDYLQGINQLTGVLNTISLAVLIILFLIIMVGITNTFRMIMYERIREIGTMRAVGVQRGDVRNMFIFEALFLSLGGVLAGFALSIVAGLIISLFGFPSDGPLGLFTINGHFSFPVQLPLLVQNTLVVLILTGLSISFPARKAAKLNPADALRTTN